MLDEFRVNLRVQKIRLLHAYIYLIIFLFINKDTYRNIIVLTLTTIRFYLNNVDVININVIISFISFAHIIKKLENLVSNKIEIRCIVNR